MMSYFHLCTAAVLLLATPLAALAGEAASDQGARETSQQRDARMKWWREARFGMFIHWGVYSVPAGVWQGRKVGGAAEWMMNVAKIPVADYAKFTALFNPVNFDARRWVSIAKDAGMKYIVITAKHHDGFAMFGSKATTYNIVDATPFKRDPLKELAEACHGQGIKLGFYYSQAQDWHHPGGAAAGGHWDKAQDGNMDEYLRSIAVPQVREILSTYGPIAILWFDTPVDMTAQRAAPFLPLLKLQPGLIVNNRLGGGFAGDTETPEQYIPATGYPGRDFETCMTMNDSWGFKKHDDNWKSAADLVRNLIDVASKGGNYLLNIGPTALGEIPPPSAQRLAEMGRWMRANGETIYGTTAGPFRRYSFAGRCTVKGNRLFVHVFDWPQHGVRLRGLKTAVTSASFLDGGASATIEATTTDTGINVLTIQPPRHLDALATVVVLDLTASPQVDERTQTLQPADDGSITLEAADAVISGSVAALKGGYIGNWTNQHDSLSWQVNEVAAGKYAVELIYSCDNEQPGSKFVIAAGEGKVTGEIGATGGWDRYITQNVGRLTLGAGPQTLTLKATLMPHGAVMNLKQIKLTPAQ